MRHKCFLLNFVSLFGDGEEDENHLLHEFFITREGPGYETTLALTLAKELGLDPRGYQYKTKE